MKYFIDTEFIEGFHKPLFGKKRHFIDLISIGIVAEDGRTYYAVSNEFNPKDADDWVRENVIDKIEAQLFQQQPTFAKSHFNFSLKELLKQYGKPNKQIATEVEKFCKPNETRANNAGVDAIIGNIDPNIEFYGYYADYDWVLFCSLFGRMIDLPKGFPMYCKDLKQILDETLLNYKKTVKYFDTERRMAFSGNFEELTFADSIKEKEIDLSKYDLKYKLDFMKKYHSGYPKQENEHNALDDAKWNFELYKFIQGL